jgi:hypothetical protein
VRLLLRRPIDQDKHIREIDGLRLLAVVAVVVSHIAPSVARHYQDVTGVKRVRVPPSPPRKPQVKSASAPALGAARRRRCRESSGVGERERP